MDYSYHYQKLIEKRKLETPEGYTERHHIFPTCQGGPDIPANRVRLTAGEHFVAHLLLAKMNPDHRGLWRAAFGMSNGKKYGSRKYAWLKKKYSETPFSIETREKMSKSHKGIFKSEKCRENQSESAKIAHAEGRAFSWSKLSFDQLSEAGKIGGKIAGKLGKGKHKPLITCPHCEKSGGNNAMKRWHFDNCRHRDA